jgi:hypothetical protein
LQVKINRHEFAHAMPFLAGAAVLMLTYPTLAYEYNLPAILCFIPLFLYWAKLPHNPIHPLGRGILKYAFLVFGCLAALFNYTGLGKIVMGEHLLISAVLLLAPLYYYWKDKRIPKAAAQ